MMWASPVTGGDHRTLDEPYAVAIDVLVHTTLEFSVCLDYLQLLSMLRCTPASTWSDIEVARGMSPCDRLCRCALDMRCHAKLQPFMRRARLWATAYAILCLRTACGTQLQVCKCRHRDA